MSPLYKIEAIAVIHGKIAHLDLIFADEKEADQTYEFLSNLEEVGHLTYKVAEPMTFKEFKQKLGARFDILASKTNLETAEPANTVAA